jgi:hypothetical protein
MNNAQVYVMSSEQELNASILKMNMFIQKYYPELMKYVGEMPITIPNEEKPAIGADFKCLLQFIVCSSARLHTHASCAR